MKTKLVSVFLATILPLFAFSQIEESEELLLFDLDQEIETQHDQSQEEDRNNSAKLLQLGHHNSAETDQNNDGSFNLPNIVTAFQHGVNNEVFILQAGTGNKSSAVQQGISNEYELHLVGDENKTRVIQQGADNSVEQYITADGIDYTVIQQGLSNDLIQIEDNPEMPNYTIIQRGIGISVRIENVSVY